VLNGPRHHKNQPTKTVALGVPVLTTAGESFPTEILAVDLTIYQGPASGNGDPASITQVAYSPRLP
jgi:hypothetical protein